MSFHSQEHQEMQSFNPTLLYIAPKIHGDAFKIIDFAKKNIEILASLLKYVYFCRVVIILFMGELCLIENIKHVIY